jgi:hypothetical protein
MSDTTPLSDVAKFAAATILDEVLGSKPINITLAARASQERV